MVAKQLVGTESIFAQEAHLRSILETAPDAIVVIDENGHTLSFSTSADHMFGFSEDEVLSENVSMLMPSPGLGPSISATIVSAHGGRIWAEPSKLGGTAFHFTIIDADSEEARA